MFPRTLRWVAGLFLAGRAWEHLRWDPPYRAIFWDEALWGWWPALRGQAWTDYVNAPATDAFVNDFAVALGGLFALGAAAALLTPRHSRVARSLLWTCTAALALHALATALDHPFFWPQFAEHAAQLAAIPVLLWHGRLPYARLTTVAKMALAITFVAHGLFAVGAYPVPGRFVEMSILGFDLTNAQAASLLWWAGVLDFMAAVLLFFPATWHAAAIYMLAWGFLTAMARLTTNVYWDFFWPTLDQWAYEFLVRVPHFGLAVWILLQRRR